MQKYKKYTEITRKTVKGEWGKMNDFLQNFMTNAVIFKKNVKYYHAELSFFYF